MITLSDTTPFLEQLTSVLRTFDCQHYPAENMPRADWEKLVKSGVMLPLIPKAYGGRESHEEMCHIIRKAAYYNVSLAIYINITGLLFIRNLVNHGSSRIKQEFIDALFDHAALGGFAVTDPISGSDPTLMQAWYQKVEGGYRITGRKHWQAFSKTAGWWLIVARNKDAGSDTFNCFIHNRADGGFNTLETYAPVGTRLIDYGLNEMDVFIPEHARLNIDNVSFAGLLELIGAAWSQWSSVGCGFLERIYEAAVAYVQRRQTASGTLLQLGYVQYRLGMIAAARNVCQALFTYILHRTDIREKGIRDIFVVRSAKALSSDLMLTAALHYQQLCGGEGYRYDAPDNIAAQALQDARGFSLLGGSNDMLYAIIGQYFMNLHPQEEYPSLYSMLQHFSHTADVLHYIDEHRPALEKIPQGHTEMVLCGRILARLFGITAITLYSETLQLDAANTLAAISICRTEITGILAEWAAAAAVAACNEKK
jgi:alkylation response protein AidB-like acyl-CoA dehydrogenase